MAIFNLNVTAYDNVPATVGDGQKELNYGEEVTLTREDFTTNTNPPYHDPEGDTPLNLKVTSLPESGILKLNGVAVTVNQEISFANSIDKGHLTYTPDLSKKSAHSAAFDFEISDSGSNIYSS